MKKKLALDIGDKWVGTALSDLLGITCKPYETVELENLSDFLTNLFAKEPIGKVIVGYPKTFSGTESDQTKKIVTIKEQLEQAFPGSPDNPLVWVLWDERLSSKRADEIKGNARDAQSKRKSHSVAAAVILQSYLDCNAQTYY